MRTCLLPSITKVCLVPNFIDNKASHPKNSVYYNCRISLQQLCSVWSADAGLWSYNPSSRPHEHMDMAHLVQVQLQMHATGAQRGYLCSWSVANGSNVFKTHYNPSFVRAASKVLQQVVSKYLQAGSQGTDLPKCDITQEDKALRDA